VDEPQGEKRSVEKNRERASLAATYNGDALVTDVRRCIARVGSGSHEKIGEFLRVKLWPYANIETFAGH